MIILDVIVCTSRRNFKTKNRRPPSKAECLDDLPPSSSIPIQTR